MQAKEKEKPENTLLGTSYFAVAPTMRPGRLLDAARHKQQQEEAEQRRSQVGTGERSEKIRTYNFPQGRVTDHRIGLSVHKLQQILEGDLDDVTDALIEDEKARALKGASP